jgi:L-alanine-DL-glutamate epimerase-like enolase superfamily enzyme
MGIHVIGAVDVALWDIRGKLHGAAMRDHLVPYANILPAGEPGEQAIEDAERRMAAVRAQGFTDARSRRCRRLLATTLTLSRRHAAVARLSGPTSR